MRAITALLAAAVLTVPVLTGCTPDAPEPAASSATSTASAPITLGAGWAKAGKTGGMTGLFGTLSNSGDEDLTITSVESSDAGMIELHEVTAEGVMQPIKGDVIVPAGGSFELAPGANHIMLMDLNKDLLAGDEVSFTLHLASSDGSTSTVTLTAFVKDYAGANESYGDGEHGEMDPAGGEHDGMDQSGMDQSGMDHGDESHDSQ